MVTSKAAFWTVSGTVRVTVGGRSIVTVTVFDAWFPPSTTFAGTLIVRSPELVGVISALYSVPLPH